MRQSALHTMYRILLKGMTVPVDARLHSQGQVMLLNVILLTSLITRLNIILSVENYMDIKKEVQVVFTQARPLINHTLKALQ